MDIKQDINNPEEIDKLRLETKELKKDLERERLLHNMLYKEWKELQEQASAKESEVVEHRKAGNGFYKYAFYILLIIMVPVFYFLYPPAGFQKTHEATRAVPNASLQKDTVSAIVSTTSKNAVAKIDAGSPPVATKKDNKIPVHTLIVTPTELKPVEKKLVQTDSNKKSSNVLVRKAVVEGPITDDIRDSIASEGFSGYFYHNRNPYRPSTERYKIWVKGWNNGKEEGKKVVVKDPSLKNK